MWAAARRRWRGCPAPLSPVEPLSHAIRSFTATARRPSDAILRRLADRDFALDRTMIPLGSCTMKLNAAVEMEPIDLEGIRRLHPFAPAEADRRLPRR